MWRTKRRSRSGSLLGHDAERGDEKPPPEFAFDHDGGVVTVRGVEVGELGESALEAGPLAERAADVVLGGQAVRPLNGLRFAPQPVGERIPRSGVLQREGPGRLRAHFLDAGQAQIPAPPVGEDAEPVGLPALARLPQVAVQLLDPARVRRGASVGPGAALDLDHQTLGLDVDAVLFLPQIVARHERGFHEEVADGAADVRLGTVAAVQHALGGRLRGRRAVVHARSLPANERSRTGALRRWG